LTFDKIYILDLHGNSNKKEVALDGSKDEMSLTSKPEFLSLLGSRKRKSN
jgi:hypothetical protein